jgi:hypothetical protein
MVVAVAYLSITTFFLVPRLNSALSDIRTRMQLRSIIGPVLALVLVLSYLGIREALVRAPSIIDTEWLLHQSFAYSSIFPGLFLVNGIAYYGPVLLVAAALWPRVGRITQAHGLGAVLIMAMFLVMFLFTESRKVCHLVPLVLPFIVIAITQVEWRKWAMPALAIAAVVYSRVWLPIGTWPFRGAWDLYEFPAQKLFMGAGYHMHRDVYDIHVWGLIASTLVLALALSRPTRHRSEL